MSITRKLPVGVQDFEKLRTGNNVYVDKTTYIYKLIQSDAPYFLGRPRRFGKSLFLSTLKAYFLGKKELFEGLAIAELEKEWIKYPVFYIDFNPEAYIDLSSIHSVLNTNLKYIEAQWGKDENATSPSARLEGLIRRAYEQTGRKVVVLVDEYDKPLVSTMDNLELNEAMRMVLKGFYGVLKSSDAYLHFVFLTGVTRFSKVSIFSDLNQLQDISMDSRFSGICGITETELIRDFQPELHRLAEDIGKTYEETFAELKKRYDGYHFCEDTQDIYNPFSLLNTFSVGKFKDYWYATGTPTFLAKMLKNIDYDIKKLENDVQVTVHSVTNYRMESDNPVPLLYQSGYLTIKDYDQRFDQYTLGFPNEEVKYGFLNELMPVYISYRVTENSDFSVVSFIKDLIAGNVDNFMNRLKAFFADIPNELNNKEEKHYQTVFYLLFKLMGQFIQTEVSSAIGRADAVAVVDDTIYIFEFKLTGKGSAEDALKQIDEREYAAKYAVSGKKIVKIGADFDTEKRSLHRWLQG